MAPLLIDDSSLVFRKMDTTPSHRPLPEVQIRSNTFLRVRLSYTRISRKGECLIQSLAEYKSTAGSGRIGLGAATHQTANLCSKLNCAACHDRGPRRAHLFQRPDLENTGYRFGTRPFPQ